VSRADGLTHAERVRAVRVFGDRVRRRRRALGLSQRALGQLVGASERTVAFWEGLGYVTRAPRLARLAAVLTTTPDYLLGRSETP
jgi:transcriptional regulator with XRE-family HTH domain